MILLQKKKTSCSRLPPTARAWPTATIAALMDMECEIFMGKEDTERQALNVYKMKLLGAKVNSVESGTATLKDAVSETMREWTKRIDDTHYVIGSVMGPHPFPTIVRDFQAIISKEIKEQIFKSVSFIGLRSTDGKFSVESHILDEKFDLKLKENEKITLIFKKFLRENRHFDDLTLLKKQIQKDCQNALKCLKDTQ